MTHNELAARIERAEGPDWHLDAAIYGLLHPDCPVSKMPAYTASIDAAMQLVPEGREWSVDAYNSNGVYPEHVRASAWVQGNERVFASTPAIALCAAAIRARSAS